MPNHRGWTESQLSAALPESPTNIDVVASDTELRVKSSNGGQIGFTERHVATGDMFRFAV